MNSGRPFCTTCGVVLVSAEDGCQACGANAQPALTLCAHRPCLERVNVAGDMCDRCALDHEWVCEDPYDGFCTALNPHRSKSCGWQPYSAPFEIPRSDMVDDELVLDLFREVRAAQFSDNPLISQGVPLCSVCRCDEGHPVHQAPGHVNWHRFEIDAEEVTQ